MASFPLLTSSTTPSTGILSSLGISTASEAETAIIQSVFNTHLPQLSEGVHLTPEQKAYLQPQSELLQLPRDVLCLILRHLNGQEFASASRVCQRFHQTAEHVYKFLLEKEFPWRTFQKGVSFQKQYHDAAAFHQNVKNLEFEKIVLREGRERCDCNERTFSSSDRVQAVKTMGNLLILKFYSAIEIKKKNARGCLDYFQEIFLPKADGITIHVLEPFLFITAYHPQNCFFFQLQQKGKWFEQVSVKKCFGSVVGDYCLIKNPENHSLSVMKVGTEGTLEEQQVLEIPESERALTKRIRFMKESGGLLVVQYKKSDSSSYFMIWEKNQKGEYKNLAQLNGDYGRISFLQRSGDFLFAQVDEQILYWRKGETSFNCIGDNFSDVESFDVFNNLIILRRSRPEDFRSGTRGVGKLEFFHFNEEENPKGLKLLHTMTHINDSLLIGDLLLIATDDEYSSKHCEPYLEVWQIEANGALKLLKNEGFFSEIDNMKLVNDSLILEFSNGERQIRYFSAADIKQQREIKEHSELVLSVEESIAE